MCCANRVPGRVRSCAHNLTQAMTFLVWRCAAKEMVAPLGRRSRPAFEHEDAAVHASARTREGKSESTRPRVGRRSVGREVHR